MKQADGDFEPYALSLPAGAAIPLVCDSPHSGIVYPQDFKPSLALSALRSGEDTYVEELWRALPDFGACLLAANFPRTYIDPNRETDDIDAGMLAGVWPLPLRPGEKTRLGHGLIWRLAERQPIYDRKLTVTEVEQRIRRYHQPYHAALNAQIEDAYRRFGAVWHLNLHSMPSNSYELLEIKTDKTLADFVLGDHDGRSCAPELIGTVERFLAGRGYAVARNDPFKGVALTRRIGRPAERRHSLQIEIKRTLYMNEETYEKSAGFAALQETLTKLAAHLADFVRAQLK